MVRIVILLTVFLLCGRNAVQGQLLSVKLKDTLSKIEIYGMDFGQQKLLTGFYDLKDTTIVLKMSEKPAMYKIKYGKREYKMVYSNGKTDQIVLIKPGSCKLKREDKQNRLLREWYELSQPVRCVTYDYAGVPSEEVADIEGYFGKLKTLLAAKDVFLDRLDSGDTFFDRGLRLFVNADVDYMRLFYMQCPLVAYTMRSMELPEELYGSIYEEKKFKDEELLTFYPNAMMYIYLYPMYAYKKMPKPLPPTEMIASPRVAEAYLLFMLENNRDFKKHESLLTRGKHLIQTPEVKARIESVSSQFKHMTEGNEAMEFVLPDKNGNTVRFSDFRGKLVVIDLWATWCAPCCRARPFFEALAEEMKDEPVVFLSISCDQNDKYWKKQVADATGIDLIDVKGSVNRFYGVSGIPRFMVFGKDGKIISLTAPSPNNGDLKKFIQKHL